ncbi:RinA family protein [Lactococcus raffinolactis]|uniref:RinA family protein n=1 Tax=Pseudolactococcus raffinolactis TaxID=1366 RepID=UPI0039B044EF
MADKLDRVIADYVNGRIDAKIKSIESRYLYRQKVDNLGIRTSYSGGSEQESHVMNKEDLDNDAEFGSLKEVNYIFSMWYEPLRDVEKEVIKLKLSGYTGLPWYRVMMELDLKDIDISQKQAKRIFYQFKRDIEPFILHCLN